MLTKKAQRASRIGVVIQKRATKRVRSNRPSSVNRIIPYVIDYANTKDISLQYVKSLTEVYVETEAAIILFYVLMAVYSLRIYKQPKSQDVFQNFNIRNNEDILK